MAGKNRTELKTETDSNIVATLQISDHRDYLKDDIIESALLRKDVISTDTPSGGNVSIDYSLKDLSTITTTANLTVSFSNLDNGDVKYIEITKNAGNTISFSGAVDESLNKEAINEASGVVVYKVINKNNNIYVQCVNYNDITNVTDGMKTKVVEIGDWNMDSTGTINVNHGVTYDEIVNIQVLIRSDAGAAVPQKRLLNYSSSTAQDNGSFFTISGTTYVTLVRETGGVFDNTDHDDTSYNRGWIIVSYI